MEVMEVVDQVVRHPGLLYSFVVTMSHTSKRTCFSRFLRLLLDGGPSCGQRQAAQAGSLGVAPITLITYNCTLMVVDTART